MKMKTTAAGAWPVLLGMFLAVEATGQTAGVSTKGDLSGNLALLNQWTKAPQGIERFYQAAYKILAADPQSTFADLSADNEIQRLAKEHGLTHLGGPLLGSVAEDGARIWLRTLRPAKVEVRLVVDGAEQSFGPVASTLETDLTAVVPVTGLKPAARYPYRVLVDGQPIAMSSRAALTTAPSSTPPSQVRIAFGSCQHRWGLGNPKLSDLIRSREPAALLNIGDIAVQDRKNHLGLHRADYLLRDFQPAWQNLVASVPVFATWDDHDYFANDKAGIPKGYTQADRTGVWDVFQHAWNNPQYGFGQPRGGVFLRTRIGPCDVILTDGRFFRTGQPGSFLGENQMKWLEAQLLDCQGPFIILSSSTMWSDYVSAGKDSWGRFDPKGRQRLLEFIETHRIGGVLLISGDRHGARGFRIPRPSGFNFYEFEAASLGGRKGPPATKPGWTEQLFGMAGEYAFGEFTVDATLPDPEVVFRLIREDGQILYDLKLTRSQLTPPARPLAASATATPRRLASSTTGAARQEAAVETLVYKRVSGRELKLFIEKPDDWKPSDRRPAIVFYFGGGWVRGTATQFLKQSQYLASRGLVGIRVEYRTIPKGDQGPPTTCCADAKSALRWVRAHAAELGVDPNRIAAAGGSAGGHLAAFTALVEGLDDPQDNLAVSCKPNALVLFNPVFNNGPGQWGHSRVGERYQEFSPAHNITSEAPPTVVFLGDQDRLIPVSVLRDFEARMKQAGVRCDTHVYPGAAHGFFNRDTQKAPWFSLTLTETDKFLASLRWLQGEPTLTLPRL